MTTEIISSGNLSQGVRNLIARHIVGFALNFVGTIVLARTLGPGAWGVYSIAYAAQLIVHQVLERGGVGFLAQRREAPTGPELGTTLAAQLGLGGIAAIALAALAPPIATLYGASDLLVLLPAVALSLLAYALRAVPLGMLERSVRYARVGMVEIADIATFNAIAIASVVAGLGLGSLALAIASRSLVSLALAWRLAGIRPSVGLSVPFVRQMVAFTVPYTGSNALAYLNGAAAPILVGGFAGAREFGVLQLAYTFIAYPQVLSGIVGRVAFPVYARMGDANMNVRESVGRATGLLIRLLGTATLVVAITSPLWVTPLYGPAWVGMTPIMLTIAPALALGTSLTLITAALNAKRLMAQVFGVNVIFSVSYWLLATLLVPSVGAVGLPLAYAIGSVALVRYVVLARRVLGPVQLRATLSRFLVSAALLLMSAVWFALGGAPIAYIIFAAIITAWALRGLDFASVLGAASPPGFPPWRRRDRVRRP